MLCVDGLSGGTNNPLRHFICTKTYFERKAANRFKETGMTNEAHYTPVTSLYYPITYTENGNRRKGKYSNTFFPFFPCSVISKLKVESVGRCVHIKKGSKSS